jgi:hypothetical protein
MVCSGEPSSFFFKFGSNWFISFREVALLKNVLFPQAAKINKNVNINTHFSFDVFMQ